MKSNSKHCTIKVMASIFCFFMLANCRKAVQVDPPITGLVTKTVFSSNASASAAVTGIYISMANGSSFFSGGINGCSSILGLSADEFKYYSTDVLALQIYSNSQVSTKPPAVWAPLYNYIYQANAAIEGLSNSQGVSYNLKQQLIGEAKFIRALCHFYLLNIYGNIPSVTTTDYRVNTIAHQASSGDIYGQIIADLKDAQSLLSDSFLDPLGAITVERVRPNKGAATALLARVYLYKGDWANAESQSGNLINNSVSYSLITDLNSVFLKNSKEAIWQLLPIFSGFNTFDGNYFILTSSPSAIAPCSLSLQLLNAFETGDVRKSKWIGSFTNSTGTYFYPNKYKIKLSSTISEYITVFRLSEQYLIRAEARAKQNNLSGALNDLNLVRNRAGLGGLPTTLPQSQILQAIEQERRVELFSEYGHRWLDLKRLSSLSDPNKSRADEIMPTVTPIKGGTWSTTAKLFPIPQTEIQVNPNLVQNPGYQ